MVNRVKLGVESTSPHPLNLNRIQRHAYQWKAFAKGLPTHFVSSQSVKFHLCALASTLVKYRAKRLAVSKVDAGLPSPSFLNGL